MFTDFSINDACHLPRFRAPRHFPDLRHADHNAHLEALVASQLADIVNGNAGRKTMDNGSIRAGDHVQ